MMKKTLTLAATSLCIAFASPAIAHEDERTAHFEAAHADSIEGTVANLEHANEELAKLLAGDLTDHDMHEVHSLSYTLEESLLSLIGELQSLHDTVADMHFQSEGMKREAVIDYGEAYLDGIGKIIR